MSHFFPIKIPEAYFIRDPHTFLLTKDFIEVYVLYLVLNVFFGLQLHARTHRLTFPHLTLASKQE